MYYEIAAYLLPIYAKNAIILPRQARDKHSLGEERSKKRDALSHRQRMWRLRTSRRCGRGCGCCWRAGSGRCSPPRTLYAKTHIFPPILCAKHAIILPRQARDKHSLGKHSTQKERPFVSGPRRRQRPLLFLLFGHVFERRYEYEPEHVSAAIA
eukprot:COSAG06_NODE_5457_length_3469_cov_2.400297_3_plen_154_part_00